MCHSVSWCYRPGITDVSSGKQEMLLDQGIALVLNVSRDTLDRLALCLGSEVMRSLVHMTARGLQSMPPAEHVLTIC